MIEICEIILDNNISYYNNITILKKCINFVLSCIIRHEKKLKLKVT